MDLTSPQQIKELMLRYDNKPKKRLGQNFLIHQPTLGKIIQSANITNNDTVLEIGPGLGVLTTELANHAKKVIAIEKDSNMISILKETLVDAKNVEIIQDDALKGDYRLPTTDYKLVANIPYYLTSPLIRKFLESDQQPKEIILMIQKEVAQRICSAPPNMSLLAVAVQFYAKAKIVSYVSKSCFWPAPKIDSAIIKIIPTTENAAIDRDLFFNIVRAGFSQPRKQLVNNLSKSLKKDKEIINEWLLKNHLGPKQRAESLNIQDWIELTKNFDL